jgi:short-subunit dehydrogenase
MKNAIVFGATSGIGKSLTDILVKKGYRVAVTGRRLPLLEALKKEFPNQILIKQNDIQDVQDVERIFGEIVAEFDTIDLIVQSSGVGFVNPKLEWSKEEQSINTNVLGPLEAVIFSL